MTRTKPNRLLARAAESVIRGDVTDQVNALYAASAPRFAVGDPAEYFGVRVEVLRVEVPRNGVPCYALLSAEGVTFERVPQGHIKPAKPYLISRRHISAHGAHRACRSMFADEVLQALGVAKLPSRGVPVRFIQGHTVYALSIAEARDVGAFHRVRIVCDTCREHVPAGRMHQHKCI